jgi:hypothetical protein
VGSKGELSVAASWHSIPSIPPAWLHCGVPEKCTVKVTECTRYVFFCSMSRVPQSPRV